VELIYYRQMPKFFPVGFRALTLPMPDAPVIRMWWSLYLPENYRFPYFGGDVEKGQAASLWNGLIGASRADRDESMSLGGLRDKRKEVLKKDFSQLASRMMASQPAAAAGQLFNFGQIMVVGQDPMVTLVFLHVRLVKAMMGILLALFGIALYRWREQAQEFLLKLAWLGGIRGRIKSTAIVQ